MSDDLVPDLRHFIRPGDRIIWSEGTAEPLALTEALVAQRARLELVHVFLGIALSNTLRPEHADHISISSYGALGTARRLAAARVLDIIPCHAAEIANYVNQGLVGCDVVMVQLSPPGPDGRHSLGVMNDYIRDALVRARVVLAEVNDHMPWTYGNALPEAVHIDFSVHTSRSLLTVREQAEKAVNTEIARHAVSFINDGATLQTGIGATPDSILRQLGNHQNLGIHSGTIGDTVLDLIERGVVTNARKPVDQGKTVTASLFGTKRLYEYAHKNPSLLVHPFKYIYSESILRQLSGLVTINSALEVDLTGQINAEATADGYVGGVGGHAEFVRAGHRAPGGRSLIALPATTESGRSRICISLDGPVTTARSDVDVVVTEFGAAELRGCGLRERARRLIAIAHPDWQESLEQAAHAF